MVGCIEPTPPEPIKIPGRGVFHRPEEIRRHRTLELPSTRVLLKGKIEKLSPQNRLPQDIQSRCGFAVCIGTKLHDRFAVGHDRDLIGALHIRDDQFRFASLGRVILLPLLLGKVLQKRVESFIHP